MSTTAIDLFNPDTFAQIQRIAKTYVHSEIVPPMYRVSDKNPEPRAIANCVVAMDMASRMQLPLSAVMQNLYVVKGNPAWSSKFIIAQINMSDKFETLEFELKNKGKIKDIKYTEFKTERVFTQQIDNVSCRAFTKLKGSENILWGPTVTMEMAIKEGWYTKAGSKWQTMPEVMLQYRAAKFWSNMYAPEATLGFPTIEEIEETIDIPHEVVEDEIKPVIQIQPPVANEAPAKTEKPEEKDSPKEGDKQEKNESPAKEDKPEETEDNSEGPEKLTPGF